MLLLYHPRTHSLASGKHQPQTVSKFISRDKMFSHCLLFPLSHPIPPCSCLKCDVDRSERNFFLEHCVDARSFCYNSGQRDLECFFAQKQDLLYCHWLWKRAGFLLFPPSLPVLGASKWGQQTQGSSPWEGLWRPKASTPVACLCSLCGRFLQRPNWPVLPTLYRALITRFKRARPASVVTHGLRSLPKSGEVFALCHPHALSQKLLRCPAGLMGVNVTPEKRFFWVWMPWRNWVRKQIRYMCIKNKIIRVRKIAGVFCPGYSP